jgi:hypothetical protein
LKKAVLPKQNRKRRPRRPRRPNPEVVEYIDLEEKEIIKQVIKPP